MICRGPRGTQPAQDLHHEARSREEMLGKRYPCAATPSKNMRNVGPPRERDRVWPEQERLLDWCINQILKYTPRLSAGKPLSRGDGETFVEGSSRPLVRWRHSSHGRGQLNGMIGYKILKYLCNGPTRTELPPAKADHPIPKEEETKL